jgi:membrane fusion protein, multidrug efflux system
MGGRQHKSGGFVQSDASLPVFGIETHRTFRPAGYSYRCARARASPNVFTRRWLAGLGLAILLMAIPFRVGLAEDGTTHTGVVGQVKTVVAHVVPFRPGISVTGDIEARTSSNIAFQVSGRVTERLADVGDHVDADQVLARVDGQQQHIDVDTARAALTSAQAVLRQAILTYDRKEALLATNSVAKSELDTAREGLKVTKGSVAAAKAQLQQAEEQLGYTALRAGVSGIVTARSIETGEVVQAGQTVYTIAVDGPRDAVFDVPEVLVDNLPKSAGVVVSLLSNPSVTAKGTVREVSPVVDSTTGTVRVKVGFSKTPAAMTLGVAVNGSLIVNPRPSIVLPVSALCSVGGKPAVWLVDPVSKTVSLHLIDVGRYTTNAIVVAGGIKRGATVVVAGGQMLWPGETVTIRRDKSP